MISEGCLYSKPPQSLSRSAAAGAATTAAQMTALDWATSFWITLVDEQGDTFYANPATGERRWLLEPGKIVLPTAAQGQWYELFSEEYALPYYFHSKTQETRWYKPDGFIIPLRAVQETSKVTSACFSIDGQGGGRPVAPTTPEVVHFDKPLPITPRRSDVSSSLVRSDNIANQESENKDSTLVAPIGDSDTDGVLGRAVQFSPPSQLASASKLVERSALAVRIDEVPCSIGEGAGVTLEDFLISGNVEDSGCYADPFLPQPQTSPRLANTFQSISRSLTKGIRRTRSTSGICSTSAAFRASGDSNEKPQGQGAVPPPGHQLVRKLKKFPPDYDYKRSVARSTSTFGISFLESTPINELVSARFAARPKALFTRKSGSDHHPIRWQAADLDHPILTLPKQLHWDALECFTQIQYIMGDKMRASDSSSHINLTVTLCTWNNFTSKDASRLLSSMWTTPDLQDEVYLQLVCQLVYNPSATSIFRGWQLMQVLLTSIRPSSALIPALRYFFGSHLHFASDRISIIARFALRKLEESNAVAARARLPTIAEIGMMCDAAFQPMVFGETLDRVMSLQRVAYPEAKVPVILSFLADGIIALGGLTTFGIFRTQADSAKVAQLRNLINQGTYTFGGFEDPHIAAAVFKMWLRELTSPVIPPNLHAVCVATAGDDATMTIVRLPELNRRILVFVITFLQGFIHHTVTAHTSVTTAELAMIFTPCLIRKDAVDTAVTYIELVANERAEQTFILSLIENLDVRTITDKDCWTPQHGQDLSESQNSASTMLSQVSLPIFSGSVAHFDDISHRYPDAPQPSLDSQEASDTASLVSTTSGQRDTIRLQVQSPSSDKSSSLYVDAPEEMLGRRRTMSESDASFTVVHDDRGITLDTTYKSPISFVRPTVVIR